MLTNDVFKNRFYNSFFFVIGSDQDLSSVESKLYGYALDNCDIYFSNTEKRLFSPVTDGCFVNVINDGKEIVIQQDYYGGYALYLFVHNKEWAVANNIYYLIAYLASRYKLEINHDYISLMLSMPSGPQTYEETIIRQIKRLPFSTEVYIDIKTKELFVHSYSIREYFVPVNSFEAFEIIDRWHSRWHAIAMYISKHWHMRADISGGKDSRTALSVLFAPAVPTNNINFHNSIAGDMAKDGPIAARIAEKLQFGLNANIGGNATFRMPVKMALQVALLSKGMIDPYWGQGIYQKERSFHLGGLAAESIRAYSKHTVQKSVDLLIGLRPDCYSKHVPCAFALMERTVQDLAAKYATDEISTAQLLMNRTRVRNHFYSAMLENYMCNQVTLAPLADYNLTKIRKIDEHNDDLDLLFAIILDRYIPDVKDIEFDSGKYIKRAAWDYAHALNMVYPVKDYDFSVAIHEGIDMADTDFAGEAVNDMGIDNLLYNEFKTGWFGEEIKRIFGNHIYNFANDLYDNKSFWRNYNLHNLYSIINVFNLFDNAVPE